MFTCKLMKQVGIFSGFPVHLFAICVEFLQEVIQVGWADCEI